MRQRPWTLVILAALHFLAPIGNIIFNAVISNRNIMNYFIFAMSPEYLSNNWILLIAPVIAGYAIYTCKRWSFYVYLVAITALFLVSYLGYASKSEAIGLFPLILVYLVNIVVVSYFLIPAIRNIYFDRRMRWWEVQARYKCNFKCTWSSLDGSQKVQGLIGNISENGLFLKSDELPEDNQCVIIDLPFNYGMDVQFSGAVILHDRVDAVGFGIKFNHSPETYNVVRKIVLDLEKKGMRISVMAGRTEDSFSYWLRTFLTTGKGLFPKNQKNQKKN